MPPFVIRLAAALGLLTFLTTPATALEGLIDEARLGGTWAQPDWVEHDHPEGDQVAINAEILFTPFNWDNREDAADDFIHALLTPRARFGGLLNLDSDGTDYIYSGLTWRYDLTQLVFLEAGFGLALNNGKEVTSSTRTGIGSPVTFHETFAVGFNLTEQTSLLFQLDHLSHARIFDSEFNRGLTNTSVRLGFKF